MRAQAGVTYPVIYGVSYLRDAKGNKIIDGDGYPVAGPMAVIGTVSPNFLLDISTTLKVWKVTLNATVSWKNGGQMYGGTNGLLGYYGVSKESANRAKKIVVAGVHDDGSLNSDSISVQSYYAAINSIDESSIYKTSFLKLREVSVSFPILKTSSVTLDISAYARNILLWSEYPNFDPESSQGNTNMAGAFERFSLPQTSSFGLGLNFKF